MKKKLVSICIPVYNEAQNIRSLVLELDKTFESLSDKYDFEYIFSDNASIDETWLQIREIAKSNDRIKAVRFSKNIGFQKSIFMNYANASGDAIVQIDADLQDPPYLITLFIEKWEEGFHVVYGIRQQRPENFWLTSFRKFGYWFIDKASDTRIPRGAGDFRLLDKSVLLPLLKFKATDPYIRGIISTLGFNQIGIPYSRGSRQAGKSKFGVFNVIKLGLSGVFNHSTIPLRLGTYLGIGALFASFALSVYYIFLKLLSPNLPQGLASVHVLLLSGFGLTSFMLGIIGEYLLRIYKILLKEPMGIIVDTINLEKKKKIE
jgi:glycosyltransferase involved in cell wall biosynthesis